jgi:PTH1 family peptidyl-tRNA hydrolase
MKVVFALGNPGPEYTGSRHNAGFMVLDAYAQRAGASFKPSQKFQAEVAEVSVNEDKLVLVKPTTFYNEAGRSYRSLLDFYKLDPADTLIVHDELALPFGTVRLRRGGSDAGNNGIKSINQHGGEASARIRVGIANDQRAVMGDTDFVLGKFSREETEHINRLLMPKLLECIDQFVQDNHLHTSFTLIDNDTKDIV